MTDGAQAGVGDKMKQINRDGEKWGKCTEMEERVKATSKDEEKSTA